MRTWWRRWGRRRRRHVTAATMGILIDGISLAGAAWHIASIVQGPVAVFAPTRLGTWRIAPAGTADPTARFALIVVGTAVTLAALGRISGDTPVVGVAIAVAVTLRESRGYCKGTQRRKEGDNDQASD